MLSGTVSLSPRWCPSGPVADQDSMRVGRHLSADLLQMHTHGFAVGGRHDDGGTNCAIRTECAKQINRVVAVIPHRPRARANGAQIYSNVPFCPTLALSWNQISIGLSVAETGSASFTRLAKFFLKASSASRSFFGW